MLKIYLRDDIARPSAEFLEGLGISDVKNPMLYRGKGCDFCKNTGYKGRTGIFEILIMNDDIRRLTMGKTSSDEILASAKKSGMRTMKENAISKAFRGIIDVNEALSVIKID